MLEEAFMADAETSIGKPTGTIQELSLSPVTQAEMIQSPFRKLFGHSKHVEINGLLDVGCFARLDEDLVPEDRKIVASKWTHTYKWDVQKVPC